LFDNRAFRDQQLTEKIKWLYYRKHRNNRCIFFLTPPRPIFSKTLENIILMLRFQDFPSSRRVCKRFGRILINRKRTYYIWQNIQNISHPTEHSHRNTFTDMLQYFQSFLIIFISFEIGSTKKYNINCDILNNNVDSRLHGWSAVASREGTLWFLLMVQSHLSQLCIQKNSNQSSHFINSLYLFSILILIVWTKPYDWFPSRVCLQAAEMQLYLPNFWHLFRISPFVR